MHGGSLVELRTRHRKCQLRGLDHPSAYTRHIPVLEPTRLLGLTALRLPLAFVTVTFRRGTEIDKYLLCRHTWTIMDKTELPLIMLDLNGYDSMCMRAL